MRHQTFLAAATALVLTAAAGQAAQGTGNAAHALQKRTLSATIVGPTSVYSGDCNTWYVSVSGGTPPYEYSWDGFDYSILDNTGQSVMGGFYGIGARPIGVTVSDATGATYAGSGVIVRSGGGGDPC